MKNILSIIFILTIFFPNISLAGSLPPSATTCPDTIKNSNSPCKLYKDNKPLPLIVYSDSDGTTSETNNSETEKPTPFWAWTIIIIAIALTLVLLFKNNDKQN